MEEIMIRRTILTTFAVSMFGLASSQSAMAEDQSRVNFQIQVATSDLQMSYAKVPIGKTYAVIGKNGKQLAKFTSGRTTTLTTNCVMVPCPDTFSPDVVCWKCMGFTAQ